MALRDQPYIPLYIQDVLTDEKLIECSAKAHGIYFRLLCLLHKQEQYGKFFLKQKYKQKQSKIYCFASMLAKQMPFDAETIEQGLEELVLENVLAIENDFLLQKRMVRDGQLSLMRTENGKKGGSSVTKQYGKSGFLYLMSDGYDLHKIGISVNPQNRLYRLRSDLKLPKHFDIIYSIEVLDMGKAEDFSHNFYAGLMDGEWVKAEYKKVLEMFDLLKAKIQANSENENEIENEIQEEERGMGKEGEKLLKHKDEPENWRLEVSRFLVDAKFKFDFCAAKKINIIDLEKRMNDFVIDLNLKMDYKDAPALKRHFINHYRKHVEQSGVGMKDFKKEQTAFIEPPSIDFDSENIVRW